MKYSFKALGDNQLTRKFGGTLVGTADPYLTGYHFIVFQNIPEGIVNYTKNMSSGLNSTAEMRNVLSAACLSVTPPGGTLNKIEFTGLGGVKWAVPGNVDYGNTVSIKFLEFSKTPILDIMHGWVQLIRDYRTGVTSLVAGDDGAGYMKKQYAAMLYYFTTAPDATTIEYFACYDGVFPAKDPQDLFTSDVETVGRLDIEIEFNVDYAWHESWVKDKCKDFAAALATSKSNIEAYNV